MKENLKEDRRPERIAATHFVEACQSGDGERLLQACDEINDRTVGGWTTAIRKFVLARP
jgi:hypothetical protein